MTVSEEATRFPMLPLERLVPSLRTRLWLVGGAGVLAAIGAAWLSLTSPHASFPQAQALYRADQILSYVLIGMLWWRRRPGNAIGTILVATGFVWAAASMSLASGASVPFTIGVALEPVAAFTGFYLAMCYPQQRPQTGPDRLVAAGLALVAVLMPIMLMFSSAATPRGALNACATACPANAFLISDQPQLAALLWTVILLISVASAATACALVLVRLRSATPARRRTIVPVAVGAVLLFLAFVSFQASRWVGPSFSLSTDLEWLTVTARIVFPLGFLFALLAADLWAGKAGRRFVAELLDRPSPQRWREVVAEEIEDPRARIGYLDVGSGLFVDAQGDVVDAEQSAEVLSFDADRNGEAVVRFNVDAVLRHTPEVLMAASDATLNAIEQGRLESQVDGLRQQIASAAADERRRIQRDLHDSAQQRLVALRVHMTLAGERAKRPQDREQLARFTSQLDEALHELRTVARGQYPTRLANDGLVAALEDVATRLSQRITVRDWGTTRHDRSVERAVYYCCTEAVQNALKHAGPDAHITVSVGDRDGGLFFVVEDDGAGFDQQEAQNGTGTTNMRERMAQVGGELSVSSRPGAGTRVSGTAPG